MILRIQNRKSKYFQIAEIKEDDEDGAEAGDGAWVVLNFWANLRLAVLTRVVLTKKSVYSFP